MIIMGVDLGRARTGLSICDEEETLARPLTLLRQKDVKLLCYEICGAAAATKTKLIVMGLPRNMDGTEGESAKFAREMGEKVHELTQIPLEYWDERGTTITAEHLLNETNTRGRKRKAVLDGVAATVILDSYLQHRRIEAEREQAEQEEREFMARKEKEEQEVFEWEEKKRLARERLAKNLGIEVGDEDDT